MIISSYRNIFIGEPLSSNKMRWKFLFIIGAVLFLIPFVQGDLLIDNLATKDYSWGDDIKITGTLITNNGSFSGLLKINMICNQVSNQIYVKSIKTDNDLNFDHTAPITGLTGDCQLQVLAEGLNWAEEATSEKFIVTNEIDGTFQISSEEVQLGENVTLSAALFKSSTQQTEGFAIITISKDNETYLLDTANFKEESLIYSFIVQSLPAGVYSVGLEVTDIYGNKKDFGEVKTFKVFDSLKLTAFFDNLKPIPGETLKVEGSVRSMKDEPLEEATAIITVDEIQRYVSVVDGIFSHPIELSNTITSYNHTVKVSIQDDHGNLAEKELEFFITPIETALEHKLSQTNLHPGEEIIIIPQIFDQAGALVDGNVKTTVVDAQGKTVLEAIVNSNQPIPLEIDGYAPPGVWFINSINEAGHLTKKGEFTVEIVENIETVMVGSTIHIRNIGNVRYTQDFVVDLQNAEGTVTVREGLNLFPNESKIIYLKDHTQDGNYTVSYKDETFPQVEVASSGSKITNSIKSITGNAVFESKGSRSIFIIVIIVLVIGGILLFVRMRKKGKSKEKHRVARSKDFEEGKKVRAQIKAEREGKKVNVEPSIEKKVKKEEEPESFRYRPGDNEKSSGMFSIFK